MYVISKIGGDILMVGIEIFRLILLTLCMLLMITVNITYGISTFRIAAMLVIGFTALLSIIKLLELIMEEWN